MKYEKVLVQVITVTRGRWFGDGESQARVLDPKGIRRKVFAEKFSLGTVLLNIGCFDSCESSLKITMFAKQCFDSKSKLFCLATMWLSSLGSSHEKFDWRTSGFGFVYITFWFQLDIIEHSIVSSRYWRCHCDPKVVVLPCGQIQTKKLLHLIWGITVKFTSWTDLEMSYQL